MSRMEEALVMTPATPFAVLAERCGLSQREAAEFLKVRLDTVKSWCAGRNAAKPAVLAELRGLYANIQAAADKLAQDLARRRHVRAAWTADESNQAPSRRHEHRGRNPPNLECARPTGRTRGLFTLWPRQEGRARPHYFQ